MQSVLKKRQESEAIWIILCSFFRTKPRVLSEENKENFKILGQQDTNSSRKKYRVLDTNKSSHFKAYRAAKDKRRIRKKNRWRMLLTDTVEISFTYYLPPGSDCWEHLLHHFPEVCCGQWFDCVDAAVGGVVIIHFVLGQRHLGILFIVWPDPVDRQLNLRPAEKIFI